MQANGGVAQEATRLQKELRQNYKEIKHYKGIYAVRKRPQRKRRPCWFCENSRCNLGGRRRRLSSASDRKIAIKLIEEATAAGARETMACQEIDISQRTLQCWRDTDKLLEDGRLHAERPMPHHKRLRLYWPLLAYPTLKAFRLHEGHVSSPQFVGTLLITVIPPILSYLFIVSNARSSVAHILQFHSPAESPR